MAEEKAKKTESKAGAEDRKPDRESAPAQAKPAGQHAGAGQAEATADATTGTKEKAAPTPAAKPGRRGRAKGSKNVPVGIVHIKSTFNNTCVAITDVKGNVVSWCSAGRAGFKGSRKSTAFAATVVAQDAARQAIGHGMQEVEVRVQGPGAGRESAIRAVQSAGLTVTAIRDVTPIPHNGCRPPKRRRV